MELATSSAPITQHRHALNPPHASADSFVPAAPHNGGVEERVAFVTLTQQGTIETDDATLAAMLVANRLVGQPLSTYVADDDAERFRQFWNALLQCGQADGELHLKTPGLPVRVKLHARRLATDARAAIQLVVVSAGKRVDAAMLAANDRLQATLNAIPDLMFELDAEGRYTRYHAHRLDLLAAPPEALLGRKYTELLPPDAVAACTRALDEAARQGRSLGVTYSLDLPHGRHWFELSIAVVGDHHERTTASSRRFIVLARDITERKATEEQLRIAATAFECLEGIAVMDAQLVFLRVNRAFCDITGYTAAEVVGTTPLRLRSTLRPSAQYDAVREAARRDGAWKGELWLARKGGSEFYGRVVITAVRDARTEVSHFVVNLADITDVHLAEQARQQREAAHRDALVREVHHRIKNNLQGITGLLRRAVIKNPAMGDVIHQTIAQVQSIAFIHGLQGRPHDAGVHLPELCSAIAQEVARLWQREILVTAAPTAKNCALGERDAAPIALVLNELMVNAAKHSARPSVAVGVDIRGNGDGIEVEIVNDGWLPNGRPPTLHAHGGLELVIALLPHDGAKLNFSQRADQVVTSLRLSGALLRGALAHSESTSHF